MYSYLKAHESTSQTAQRDSAIADLGNGTERAEALIALQETFRQEYWRASQAGVDEAVNLYPAASPARQTGIAGALSLASALKEVARMAEGKARAILEGRGLAT